MNSDNESEPIALPDRSQPRFRVRDGEQLETGLQSDERCDLQVRLLDISASGAKFSVNAPLQPNESIRLRLVHQEFDLEIALPATVRWCHVKKDLWEAGASFDDAVLADDVIAKLAMDGVVERRRAKRHPVDFEARLKKAGDPTDMPILVSDISESGACVFSPRPVEIGERLLLKLNDDDSAPVSYVATSRWQKQQGAGYQLGCQLQAETKPTILETCGIDEAAKPESPLQKLKRTRASWLTWTVLIVCAACTFTCADPTAAWPFSELRDSGFMNSVTEWWPW